MSDNLATTEITVLVQVMATEDKGDKTVLHDVYKTRKIRLDINELLAKGRAAEQADNPDEEFIVRLLDSCGLCQRELMMIVDEHRTSPEDGVILLIGNIYCDSCSPSIAAPTLAISAVYDEQGAAVECECLKCPDCSQTAIIWLDGDLLCWPCIKKHDLQRQIIYDGGDEAEP